ncbi:MAG: ATP-binding protein [Acidimicrobiales bacterium]
MKGDPEVVGREAKLAGRETELDQLSKWLDGGEAAVSTVIGDAGIGKTALWRALVERARAAGWRVLVAAPAEAEGQLPFAALADLLSGDLEEALAGVPAPMRRALEVALLLREPAGAPPEPRAVATAGLAALRSLAGDQPVLVAVDDVQWLDAASGAVLGFALRRVDPGRVRSVLTWRCGQTWPDWLDRDSSRTARLELGGLSMGAVHRMVVDRLDRPLPRATLRRVYEQAAGNPLYTLELARALPDQRWLVESPEAFTPPPDLASLVGARLARLPLASQHTLVHLAALGRPTADLLRRACPGEADAGVAAAMEAGLVQADGARLSFTHPLFASVCYRSAPPGTRLEAHLRLAGVVDDPEKRAYHLALGATGPDLEVAAALDAGAREARARGAPQAAAELAELARQRTPPAETEQLCQRTTTLARYLQEGGDASLARHVLEELIEALPPGPRRARVLAVLAEILYESAGPAAASSAAHQAVQEAGQDLRARAEAYVALAGRSDLTSEDRPRYAQLALEAAEAGPDIPPGLLSTALREVALAQYHSGEGMPEPLIRRAASLEETLDARPPVAWRATTILGECSKYLDRFTDAERILSESQVVAETEGDAGSLAEILGHRAELALWLGRWEEAARLAAQSVETAVATEQAPRLCYALYFQSLVRAHRGEVDLARADAQAALTAARDASNASAEWMAHSSLGFLALSTGDMAVALHHLATVDRAAWAGVVSEPRQWRYLGDYVEALVASDRVEEAAHRVSRLQRWADGAGTAWPAVLASRSAALVSEAARDRTMGLTCLEAALDDHARLPIPFERGRTLLLLGKMRRRAGDKRLARERLEEALAIFEDLGATLWVRQSRGELGRISGRAAGGGRLTESERQVAGLVAEGRSNKEVAAALSVTVRTVEAHLTRIYGKLGARSRTELARRLG